MRNEKNLILITGATGNVGRHVVAQLLHTGARVRALTRNPNSACLPQEVDVVRADLSVPATLGDCLEGIRAVFLVWRSPTAEAVPALLEVVAKHARRIVFLSSLAVRDDVEHQTNPIGKLHADIEHLIERSGLEWTFLRPGGFATNSLWWWAPQIRSGDVVRWPYSAAAWAPIHERDIAAVAVRALTEEGHGGAKYVLTGRQSLSQADQVHTIGEAIGRPLRFEEISPEAAREQMLALMPPSIMDVLLETWARMVIEPALLTGTVAEITGAPARTFRQWAIDHAGDFRSASENSGSPLERRDRSAMRGQVGTHTKSTQVHAVRPEETGVTISSRSPDITRPDVGTVLVSEWTVGTPERGRAFVEAFVAAWERAPWPQGLLSANLFLSTDGETVLNYAQWTSDEAYHEFVRAYRQARVDQIDRAVPGIERKGPVHYRLYRSRVRDDAPRPGCVVIVSVEFDGPDEQRQRRWVDTVFEALEAEADLHPGGISGHFHLSTDGTRVLNYAEWTDEQAHREALERSGQGTIGSGPKWRQVRSFPGVKFSGYKRYHFHRSLVPHRQSNER